MITEDNLEQESYFYTKFVFLIKIRQIPPVSMGRGGEDQRDLP